MTEIADELRKACSGHPHAKIAWPHRLLHEAADALDTRDKQIAEMAAGGWQPIETATKDWSDVLLHVPDLLSDWRTVCEGYFDVDHEEWRSSAFGVVKPIHWQPLPAPPSLPSSISNG